MMPRRCYACREPILGCIMGGTCPGCGAHDTAYGVWWWPKAEQPHYRSLEVKLADDVDRALGQLDNLRRLGASCLGPSDLSDQSFMREAASAYAGLRVRLVVAIEVLD